MAHNTFIMMENAGTSGELRFLVHVRNKFGGPSDNGPRFA